jgi:hypothetical protein
LPLLEGHARILDGPQPREVALEARALLDHQLQGLGQPRDRVGVLGPCRLRLPFAFRPREVLAGHARHGPFDVVGEPRRRI